MDFEKSVYKILIHVNLLFEKWYFFFYYTIWKLGFIENPTLNEKGKTLFHFAAEHGYMEICKYFLKRTKIQKCLTKNGFMPLHFSAQNGHVKVCQLLMENMENKNPESKVFEIR